MSDLPPGYTIKKPTYDTQLSPAEETAFSAWKGQYAPRDSGADYDLRGAYKAGLKPDPATGHWPDTYKKPNHPTFSDQSMYATGENAAKAGRWEGENYIAANGGLPEGYTIKSAPTKPAGPWQQILETIGMGGNLLGLPGKNAIDKSAEFDVPYKPGMKMGQMIPQNWQENPMLGSFGPGNVGGAAARGPVATANRLLADEHGSGPSPFDPVGGGKIEPAAPTPPVPVIPPGIQPPPPTGQAMPPAQPGIPPPPGGGTTPVRPVPVIPPGAQPQRPTGGAMPPQQPGTPAPPGGTSQPSALGMAIAADNPVAVDQAVTRGYRRAIQPGTTGVKMNNAGLAEEDQRIMTTVDQIIANRKDLKLTNADGSPVPEGATPKTRRQFLEAQDQTKKQMFKEFDTMNREAGALGIQVDPTPAIQHLREVAENPAVVDLHPNVAADAKRLADNMERRGSYTPAAMQDLIQDLNGTLSSFYKNPTKQSASEGRVLAPLADILRNSLDETIMGAVGPGYQVFRQRYGALRSVERDLTNAARKELSQRPGFISEYADLLASDSFIRGVFTLSPGTIAKAGFIQAAKQVVKYTNDPNRAIERLFQRRIASQAPQPPPVGIDPYLMGATRGAALGGGGFPSQADDRGPAGGRVIQRRTITPEP